MSIQYYHNSGSISLFNSIREKYAKKDKEKDESSKTESDVKPPKLKLKYKHKRSNEIEIHRNKKTVQQRKELTFCKKSKSVTDVYFRNSDCTNKRVIKSKSIDLIYTNDQQ